MRKTGFIGEDEVVAALIPLMKNCTTVGKKAVITMLLEEIVKETGSEPLEILAQIGAAYNEVHELLN